MNLITEHTYLVEKQYQGASDVPVWMRLAEYNTEQEAEEGLEHIKSQFRGQQKFRIVLISTTVLGEYTF